MTTTPKPAAKPTRTVTICVPPREEDGPDAPAHYFAAEVDGRRVVSARPIARPEPRKGRRAR